jgi:ribose transport system permease protein
VSTDVGQSLRERLVNREGSRGGRFEISRGMKTMIGALIALLVICKIFVPDSVSKGAVLGMLPFAAVLAIIALGQTLVVQQGGIDLSVAGSVSLAVVYVTRLPQQQDSQLWKAVLIALASAIVVGIINGILISRIGINAIVATLGMSSLEYAIIMAISQGSPRRTTNLLNHIAANVSLGIPNSVYFAVAATVIVTLFLKRSISGRRFEAIGASPRAGFAAGLKVKKHQMFAYVWAQLLYSLAGILLAGILTQPTAYQGDSLVFPSVTVVVLGGTSLLGGRGFPAASAVAALFLQQLNQMVLTLNVPFGVRTLVTAVALLIGIALYTIPWEIVRARFRALSEKRNVGSAHA